MVRGRFSTLLRACAIALAGVLVQTQAGTALDTRALAETAVQTQSKLLESGRLAGRDRAFALMKRGLARDTLGDHGEALVDITEAIIAHAFAADDLARALFDRGVVLDEVGRTGDAIGDYTAALKIAPQFAPALNNRANVFRRLGRLHEAKRDYLASLAAGGGHPEYPDFGLGLIAEAEHDLPLARAYYVRGMRANPGYPLAIRRLGALDAEERSRVAVASTPTAKQSVALVLRPPKAVTQNAFHIAPAAYGRLDDTPSLRPAMSDFARIGKPSAAQAVHLVQLGAWRDEASAAEGWNRLLRQAGGALSGMTPRIVPVDLAGKGHFYRLRSEPVGSATPASVCDLLDARGIACMVVTGG